MLFWFRFGGHRLSLYACVSVCRVLVIFSLGCGNEWHLHVRYRACSSILSKLFSRPAQSLVSPSLWSIVPPPPPDENRKYHPDLAFSCCFACFARCGFTSSLPSSLLPLSFPVSAWQAFAQKLHARGFPYVSILEGGMEGIVEHLKKEGR